LRACEAKIVSFRREVERWLSRLGDEDFGQAQFYVDLLEREGVALGEPYTRQLRGKLRELRFYIGRERYRITYHIAKGRRIILLTVFKKSRQRGGNRRGRSGERCDGSMYREGA